MRLLGISFGILEFFGFWRPTKLSGWKANLYNFYTIINLIILYFLALTQLIDFLQFSDNVAELMDKAMLMMSVINSCAKAGNILQKRSEILNLIKTLKNKPCLPRDKLDWIIQNKFDRDIKWNSLKYAIFIEVILGGVIISSLIKDTPQRKLALDAWLPYSINSEVTYWITYTYQFTAGIIGSFINISYDTLIPGCMMQTCAQLEIFKHRLNDLSQVHNKFNHDELLLSEANYQKKIMIEQKIISESIKHHSLILEFAESANAIFSYTIFIQYSISFIVICASTYNLSNLTPFTPEFISVVGYCFGMLVEIFVYCFYGNIVMDENDNVRNAIYDMDWVNLSVSTKKSLLTIMTRTLKPVTFTSGYIVVLSLNSLNGVITLTQIIELLKFVENLNQFIFHSSILLTMINACAKVTNIFRKRSDIIKLNDILMTAPCCPRNYKDKKIQRLFNKIIKRNSLIYCIITELAVVIGFMCSLFRDVPQHRLTYKAWLPYNYETGTTYWITYLYQYGALVIGSLINISYDTFVVGCMIQTCAQLEIFKYRMKRLFMIQRDLHRNNRKLTLDMKHKNLINERKIICKSIEHHLQIFKF
ncbi:hypothetical protein PV326_011956, partial [Microctonus aethiopoides]